MESSSLLSSEQTISKRNERIADQIGLGLVILISLILITASILYHHGGIIHPEVHTYLPYYLSDKPLINKLYDSKVLDQDMYQARELSYFFDFLDSKFIAWSVSLGHPHFLSITNYIFLFAIGLLIWHFSTRIVSLPPVFGLAFVILYWTSPSIFFAGIFFRSSKVGVALAAAMLFIAIHGYLNSTNQNPKRTYYLRQGLALFVLVLTMTLFDRQGVFLGGIALVFLLWWSMFFPDKKTLFSISSVASGLVVSEIYNRMIGPFLTQSLNHYSPNFTYQHMPLWKVMKYPLMYAWAGTSLYLDTIRFMLGNIPLLAAGLGCIVLIALAIFRTYKEKRSAGKLSKSTVASLGLVLCNVFLFIGLDALMVLRHTPLFDADIRRVYYWIPQVTILTLTIAFLLSHIVKRNYYSTNIVLLVLVLAIAGNIYALPHHNYVVLSGYIKPANEYTPKLIEALRNLPNTQHQAPFDVLQDPVYQWFEKSQK